MQKKAKEIELETLMTVGPLRVGLLIDGHAVPAWVARIVQEIQKSDFAEISAVIINDTRKTKPIWQRILTLDLPVARLFFGLFNRLDHWIFQLVDDPFAPVEIADDVAESRQIKVTPHKTRFSDRLNGRDYALVHDMELDVLLRFGFRILRGGILNAARFGVWSYHHDDNREYRGGPALFWEIYEGNPLSGVVLQILTESLDDGHVIYRSIGMTLPWSYFRSRHHSYWKASSFMLRRLKLLHEQGFEAIKSLPTYGETITYDKEIYRTPTNSQMLQFLPRHIVRLTQEVYRRRYRQEKWFLAVNTGTSLVSNDTGNTNLRVHYAPPNHYWADPCPIIKNNQVWIFFEDYPFHTKKGVVACAPVSPDGTLGKVTTALECEYHLSYPFVFEHENKLYMIPETGATRRVELWSCSEFPHVWSLDRILIDDIKIADATIHVHDGKLWMFGAVSEAGEWSTDELHIFMAETLEGPWLPHRSNPVVSDCRNARPAGRLFFCGDALIRPAQDCSKDYGFAISLNRVDELNEDNYSEQTIKRIEPFWHSGNIGSHTFNRVEGLEFIDGRILVPKGT